MSFKKKLQSAALALALLPVVLVSLASAKDFQLSDLLIIQPTAKPTLPGAKVAGGYLTIRNNGTKSDRLVSITADFAGMTELHEMSMDGDVMRMRPIENGIEIPAGEEIVLAPGALHIMFMDLSTQLSKGENRRAILEFENAGTLEVEFLITNEN